MASHALNQFLQQTGMTLEQFKQRRKAWLHYDKDVDRLNADIESHNRGVIIICRKCRKVDVEPISHASVCDPVGEQYRRESQDVYWK